MKLYKPAKVEWLSFFLLMPFITTGCNYLLFEHRFLDTDVLIQSNMVMYIVGFLAWYTHVSCSSHINNRFPYYHQIRQRTSRLIFLHISVMASSMAVYFFGYHYFGFLGYSLHIEKYLWAVIVSFFISSIATTLWGFSYTIHKWKEVIMEQEQLKQENLQTEFESLKNQVNPHFLFNNLNSLSILIEDNPIQAEVFIDEMSKVYRYLMHTNETGLTTLAAELQFIESYYYLLKTRYNKSINISIAVADQFSGQWLPTHTLQVLVENAVKHNKMMQDSPLMITIATTAAGELVVSNNLQRKIIQEVYRKKGLTNIINKYELLNRGKLLITEENNEFRVLLPLLEKQPISRDVLLPR